MSMIIDRREPARRWQCLRLNMAALMATAFATLGVVDANNALAQSKDVPVIVAKAIQQELVDRVEALGTLRANEQVAVTAQITEIVTALHFEDGQRVQAGDVLAEMTSAEEAAQLREAEAMVRESKEQLDRAAPLAERGVSSEAVLSERRRNYETALAQVEAVKSRLADRRLEAPFGGVVGLRRVSVGALVQPGTVITTIDDDSRMKLDFTVPATYLAALKTGLAIEASAAAFSDRSFEGQIAGIDSRVDPNTRSITVRAIIPNEDRLLKAGLLMTVEVLKNRRLAIIVPEEAVIARGQEAAVYVVDPKIDSPKVERREVRLGARQKGIVEIVSGLREGEFVITDGALRVTPGRAVKVTAIDKGNEPLVDLLSRGSSQQTNVN